MIAHANGEVETKSESSDEEIQMLEYVSEDDVEFVFDGKALVARHA